MDKVKLKLPENLDPRKSHFHSNSEHIENDKLEEIEKKKEYFKEMWDKVKLETRKKIFEIYEQVQGYTDGLDQSVRDLQIPFGPSRIRRQKF